MKIETSYGSVYNYVRNNLNGNLILNNQVLDNLYPEEWIDNVVNGSLELYYDEDGNELTMEEVYELEEQGIYLEPEYADVFQWYMVDDTVRDFLIEHTDEIVIDLENGVTLWAVCHWGTAWDYVPITLKNIPVYRKNFFEPCKG